MPADEPRDGARARRRFALAAATFALAAPTAYMVQRLYERWQGGVADPLLVVREAHMAFYYRASMAVWWGGIAALVTFAALAAGPELERWSSRFRVVLWPWLLLMLVIAWRWP